MSQLGTPERWQPGLEALSGHVASAPRSLPKQLRRRLKVAVAA
jgi:hypothetical protein